MGLCVNIGPINLVKRGKVRTWWPYLDLGRGVAALLVALSHLRGFVFVDFHALSIVPDSCGPAFTSLRALAIKQ